MMRPLFSLGVCGWLALGALTLGACSSDKGGTTGTGGATGAGGAGTDAGGDTSTAAKVTVSGVASPHALNAALGMNPAGDFSQMAVAVVDPVSVLANANAAPLAGGVLDTSNCGATGCPWSFDNVDISGITLGLVGIVDDARTTGRLWVRTGTGAGSSDFINMIKASRAPITGVRLFAVSNATENKLAQFAAAFGPDSSTIVPGDLEKRGFMLGTIVTKVSEGAMPVAGATIMTADARTNILYPTANFMGVGSSTAAHGTFLVYPKLANATSVVASWTVVKPSGDTHTWTTLTAGTAPGTAFVLLFAANE